MPRSPIPILAAILAFSAGALALQAETTDSTADPLAAPATQAYMAANHKMYAQMSIEYTGKADVDFVRGMIPHHQGAVEMAHIVLEHGTDPEVKKLAEGIISAQESEIAWMQEWLSRNGG